MIDRISVAERIRQFTEWFEIEDVLGPDEVISDDPEVADPVIDWCQRHAASTDWIVLGDPKVMAAQFRENIIKEHSYFSTLKEMSDGEVAALSIVMRGAINGHFKLTDGLDVWQAECLKHREGLPPEASMRAM